MSYQFSKSIYFTGEKDNPDDYFKTTNCPYFVTQTSSPGALSEITNDMNLVNPGEKMYQTYTPKCTFGQVLAHSTPIASNNSNQVTDNYVVILYTTSTRLPCQVLRYKL